MVRVPTTGVRRAALAVGAALAAAACADPVDLPPNVILISLDTLRPDHLSVYGYERETSPFLEELARESVVYTNAYAVASWTLISHMSMLTGVTPATHGVDEERALSPEVPLLAERLRRASYHNAAVFFEGWISRRYGFDRGFDVFEPARQAHEAGKVVREIVARRPEDRPLFLFLHLFDIHCGNLEHPDSTIYDSPPHYADLFREGAADRLRGRPVGEMYYGRLRPTAEDVLDIVALYDSGVRFVDDRLREWVAEWREAGLLDDALLIVTSDHGEALGRRGTWKGHGGFYEHGLRVPLIVRYPDGRGAGTRDDRLTSAVDLVPTVLDVVGLEGDPWIAGRSLSGEPRGERDVILAERETKRVVTDGRYKALWNTGGGPPMVWDLEADPRELRPLGREAAREAGRRLKDGLAPLDERIAATPGQPIPAGALDPKTRAELEALGYAADE